MIKISIFTPTHDSRFLTELHTNIMRQDYPLWEWIVLCNGGAKFECNDARVKVIEDCSGIERVGYLKFAACKHCSGDILLEVDHDDLLLPGALREVAAAFGDPSVDFVYSNTVNHDMNLNQPMVWSSEYGWSTRPYEFMGMKCLESISADPLPQSLSRIWFAPNHLRAWRASFYWRVGGHNPSMELCDDHDLICRTYLHGRMLHINKPLYFYRVHGGNTWLKHQDKIQTTMWGVHHRYIGPMALRWAQDNHLRAVDLCGALDCPRGFESVDRDKADIVADLDGVWPFADSSVGVIRAHDAIEHLKNPIHTMNEAYRVLAHGGFFLIQVPSSEGVGAHCDPTHVSFWNWRSFRYYTEDSMQRYIRSAGAKCRFQSIVVDNVTLYDGVKYVIAHLIAIKQDAPRFYGPLKI